MPQIITHDNNGNRIILNASQEPLKVKKPAADIVIDSEEKFRLCIQRSQEEKQYHGGGDKRYINALYELLRTDRAKYMEYDRKMRNEFKSYYSKPNYGD